MDDELASYVEKKIEERKEAKKAKDFIKLMQSARNC